TLFHAGRLTHEPRAHPRADRALLVVLAALAFGIGYDFWVICALLALVTVTLYRAYPCRLRGLLRDVAFLGVAFILPAIARQIQVAAVLGFDFWLIDLVYSAAIKVSVLSRLIPVP